MYLLVTVNLETKDIFVVNGSYENKCILRSKGSFLRKFLYTKKLSYESMLTRKFPDLRYMKCTTYMYHSM